MAEPFKRDGLWVVKWQDAAGQWRQQRTSCATKDDARRLLRDLDSQADRQRRGLEPLPPSKQLTFAKLMDWWWEEYGCHLRSPFILGFANKHLRTTIGPLPLAEVSTARLESLLNAKTKELSPKSLNHLRALLHRLFRLATHHGLWVGPNPAATVARRKVPKRLPVYLKVEEFELLLTHLKPKWRPLFATAVFTGMRKGELLGLRKSDVDLAGGSIRVARSYDSGTTKGGHADLLPIAEGLRPWLEAALKRSSSKLVFPRPDGSMHPRDIALDHILRRALGRAGLVTGYIHKCRRKGCGFSKEASEANCGKCPKCNMQLWAKPVPRHVRFHDLRHTTATLLLKLKVGTATVQRVMRHTDPKVTTETYGHLELADMQAGVDQLRFNVPLPSDDDKIDDKIARRGAPVVRNRSRRETNGRGPLRDPKESAAFHQSGRLDLNQRPLGPEPSALPG